MSSIVKRIVCPVEPEPCNGAEGCGWEFGYVDDDVDDDYVVCPACGLNFDLTRAESFMEYDSLAHQRALEDVKALRRQLG